MEIYKKCEYLSDNYLVSNYGNIKNLKGFILKPIKSNSGYLYCNISIKGKSYSKFIHRAIAFAFINKTEGKNFINHKDCDKLNNCIENLEWCTRSENMKHAYDLNLMKPPVNFKGKFGKDHNRSKGVICVETGKKYGSQLEAQRELNLGGGSVSWSIKNKKPIFGMHFELSK